MKYLFKCFHQQDLSVFLSMATAQTVFRAEVYNFMAGTVYECCLFFPQQGCIRSLQGSREKENKPQGPLACLLCKEQELVPYMG